MDASVAHLIAHYSFPAVFALLLACGLGAPLSEEVICVLGGVVVGHGGHHLAEMIAVGWVGQVAGDWIIFGFGRRLGPKAARLKRFRKLLTPKRVEWVRSHYRRRGALTIFLVRFVPGVRAPAYLMAGMSEMPAWRFLVTDAAAALFTAPVLVWLGYRFGYDVLRELKVASHWVLLAAGLALLAAALTAVVARHRKRRRR